MLFNIIKDAVKSSNFLPRFLLVSNTSPMINVRSIDTTVRTEVMRCGGCTGTNKYLELPAEDAVGKAVELLHSGYVLIEGSVECLVTYLQLLELTGIVIKDRSALIVLARKGSELAKLLNINEKGLEKAVVIELKHSLPAYLQ